MTPAVQAIVSRRAEGVVVVVVLGDQRLRDRHSGELVADPRGHALGPFIGVHTKQSLFVVDTLAEGKIEEGDGRGDPFRIGPDAGVRHVHGTSVVGGDATLG